MIAPSTDIILYKSDLELDNTNQLKFNTWNDQWAYFSKLPHIYLDNATYQRKEGVIRFPTQDISFDELIRYNYVSYKNEAYANKTFFAYVKNMRYVNDGMTEIEIETDPYQTWQFDLIYRRCFVEREHVSDDTFGKHTVPEGLETGEYIESGATKYTGLGANCVIISSAINLKDLSSTLPTWHQGLLSGDGYWQFGEIGDQHPTRTNQLNAVRKTLSYMSGKTDNITCIFMCPENVIRYSYTYPSTNNWQNEGWVKPDPNDTSVFNSVGVAGDTARELDDFTFTRPTSLGSYTPRNNKLLCFPFTYLMLSNNNGSNGIYHYEDFGYDTETPTTVKFKVHGVVCPGCSIRAFPKSYKGVTDNYTVGISCGKFPICSWDTDAYTNWLTQNSVNIGLETLFNVGQAAVGIGMAATGNPMGAVSIVGGVAGVGATIKEMYNKSFIPNQCNGDIASGNISFSTGNNTFTAHQFMIKPEYAKICDDYFTMFGYKVNALKVPNIHSRKNWNYVKTIDCNFSGDIPGEDLVKLRQMFDNGITIWHNPSTFLDYSQSNYII